MSKYDKIKNLDEEKFKRLTGVKRETFSKMLEILNKQYKQDRKNGGRHRSITIEDTLLMTLEYLREYRTYYHIAVNYGITESWAYRIIVWTENTLIKSNEFSLPKRKELMESDNEIEVILVDATETPIERPKRKQRKYYSGKKNDIQ